MDVMPGLIDFDHDGIGTVLLQNRLAVPVNQREYSWKKEHVQDLLQDLSGAISDNKGIYFLGTIVLTDANTGGPLEVTDGQQRLATTTILLAAIRDYLLTRQDAEYVIRSVEHFLHDEDREHNMPVPRLALNVDDNEFFRSRILPRPNTPERKAIRATKPSLEKIAVASDEAAAHVQKIIAEHSEKNRVAELNRWITFIQKAAQVIILTVPDDVNAFVMFETLNDRGVKTTQADMMKNFLFGEADKRIAEAQHRWSGMKGVLESGDSDDVVVIYLRHFLVVRHGAIRDKEVYAKIKGTVRGPHAVIKFLDELLEQAHHYAALSNHDHAFWQTLKIYTPKVRRHVQTLNYLNVEQIRPLMLACMKRFTPKEVCRAFRLFVSWAVRFMVGGTPTGTVEKYYAGHAKEVWEKTIKSAAGLAESMKKHLPDDASFRAAFAGLRVSKTYLARYYLRCLERSKRQEDEPDLIVNDDETEVTLEHILPENPSSAWGHIDPIEAEGVYRRLGNMCLLRASANTIAGNAAFSEKQKVYKQTSSLELTKEILSYKTWGPEQIKERQNGLAELAIKTWGLDVT